MPEQQRSPLSPIETLIKHIKKGDRAGVQGMLKALPFLAKERRHKDENGLLDDATALHIAAAEGHLGIAEDLIAAGAEVDAHDFVKSTPLMDAAQRSRPHIVKFLLEKGADANHTASESYTALMLAARNGCIECADLLLKNNAHIDAVMDGDNNALHFTTYQEDSDKAIEMARFLIERGIRHDARDNIGETPAALASKKGLFALADFISTYPAAYAEAQKLERAELTEEINTVFRKGRGKSLPAPKPARFTPKNSL